MEGEIRKLVKVLISVNISLSYCYFAGKIIPKGILRLFTILPIVYLFLIIPLSLTSAGLIGPTSYFITWLANFNLLLFALGKGPLSHPSISLPLFLAHACFPIKLPTYPSSTKYPNGHSKQHPSPTASKKSQKSLFNYGIKALLLVLFQNVYFYFKTSNTVVAWTFLAPSIYFSLELLVAMTSSFVGFLFRLELDPQFDEPFLSTSLQDFWSRRWNLMVTRILKPTVYEPVLNISTWAFGRKWAPLPATLSCFFVSGLMHELIFFYLGQDKPKWEMTMFFSLHGIFLAMEIAIKKAMNLKWRLPRVIASPLVIGFILTTSYYLFRPVYIRCGLDVKGLDEYAAIEGFVKDFGRSLMLRFHR